jgi:hypothetical protein
MCSFRFLAASSGHLPRLRLRARNCIRRSRADILDKGKVYGELDGTLRPVDFLATFTPRVVVGIGHGIEAGVNFFN